ncbi:MAG TPA: hypothetical protein VMC79_07900 [Rectinemataceae bacterium]|nr:hypothetical protein [Rectinemataceae bacterium]
MAQPVAQPATSPSQDESGLGSVFAPFPSKLRATLDGTGIKLTWLDSPDVSGAYAVYRSLNSISAATLDSATSIAVVPTGTQEYRDTPPDSQPYYYAVLALGSDGNPFRIVIALRNTMSVPLAVPTAGASVPASAAETAAAASAVVPAVDNLNTRVDGDAVVLSYHPATAGMRLVLYRGAAEIVQPSDLLDASLISAFVDKNGSFADYPVPGIDYWYALLGEEDLKAGRIDLRPGHNSTETPTYIAVRASAGGITAAAPGARSTPLPSFLMDRAPDDGAVPLPPASGAPPEHPLAPETEKAVATLLATAPNLTPGMPPLRILPEELSTPSGGEDYALSLIVTGRLVSGDWNGGVDELRKYLSLNRSQQATARARFYLGEALTHTGAYRDAFFELLSAQERYTAETRPWIDYVLFRLRGS